MVRLSPICLLVLGCTAPEAPRTDVVFVRGGLLLSDGSGRSVGGDRVLVEQGWEPGESVTIGGRSVIAPLRPECVPLFSVELGDLRRLVAKGGAAPDTAVAFSPDGALLAVGSYLGEVLVLDAWTGEVRARRQLAETSVRYVAWSGDGGVLYAAEQSPDAFVHALDPETLTARWSLRLADEVETSPPPPGDDLYGLYTLPAAYGLQVLSSGDLLVAATHGWQVDGVRKNRSRVLRVSPEGRIEAAWPAQGAADAIITHPVADGALAVVSVSRSADGPAPTDLPIGGIQLLSLPALEPLGSVQTSPLEPWYQSAVVWEALDVDADRDAVMLGLSDGRVRLVGRDGVERQRWSTGEPLMAGEVPIAASVGHGGFVGKDLVYLTSPTQIPWGAASPDLRPPTAHPNANAVWMMDPDSGATRWSWSGSQNVHGLGVSEDERRLVVGAGPRGSDERRDVYGGLVFALDGPERSGEERLEAFCPTVGPVFFRPQVRGDGRVALAEFPVREADGTFTGTYRVTVAR